jgi:hypothetical protein
MVPLQQDLRRLQQRLRLKPEALDRELVLDLRKDVDLERSQLLHRLTLLDIPWGDATDVSGKGTFKEKWRLRWQPELNIALIEAGRWGNTIETATATRVCEQATQFTQLSPLTALLEKVLFAALPRGYGLTPDCPALRLGISALSPTLNFGVGAVHPPQKITCVPGSRNRQKF